jgi:hypothetical protein
MAIKEAIDKCLFFIGAGASCDAKCKTSEEMLKSLKNIVCTKSNGYFGEIECETIKFLLASLYYQTEWRTIEVNDQYSIKPNIEELALLIRRIKNRDNFLPYPVTGNWADKLVSLEAKFNEQYGIQEGVGLFEKLEDTIKNKLLNEWLAVQQTDYLEPLDDFFEKNKDDFIFEIFSLNNDLVFEKHYSEKKAKPFRGFCSGEWRGFHSKSNVEEYNRINLYKLHGSLDWVRLIDGNVIEKHRLTEEDDENKIDHDPFIIFGQGLKFLSIEPFFDLIQNFREKLKERRYFFIIGYSFFDPYINNLLIHAVKEAREENKKIIIVNPKFAIPPLADFHFTKDNTFGHHISEGGSDAKKLLTDYLEDIQRNSFYSELPEFNIKQIPTESLFYLKMDTSEFIKKFFSNSGDNLVKLIGKFEADREEGLPFKD